MKTRKVLLTVLSVAFMATVGGAMVGCARPHVHHYTSQKQMPTCTEHGLAVYSCDCGNSYSVSLYNLGHDFGEFERMEEGPTCEAYVEEVAYCERCGEWHSRMVENPFGGHIYRGGSYCATCGISFQEADKIVIDESVTRIDDYAFSYCNNLTELVIPQNITSIGSYAFYNCGNLQKVTLPNSVTYIGDYAFADCWSLTEVRLPKNLTYISSATFSNCSSLKEIDLPENVISIGESAFYNCTSLTEMEFPRSVDWIGESAFSSCTGLKKIVIPERVTEINSGVFSDCWGLEEIVIPNGVDSIGYSAFSNCNALTEIVVPDSVTEMSDSVFAGCNSLERLTLPFVGGSAYGWGYTELTSTFGWNIPYSLKTVEITSATSIGNDAFNGCGNIEEIILPENLQQIGSYAFYNCYGLTEIVVPDSVIVIGDSAFYGCENLQKITLPFVGERADGWGNTEFTYIFGWNVPYSLKTVEITSATIIPDYAFNRCYSLEEIILCDGIKEIGYEAFYYCRSLTRIVIPKSVTRIGNWAFEGCSSLTIYCEAVSKPSGWDNYWNYDNCPVEWGYKGE